MADDNLTRRNFLRNVAIALPVGSVIFQGEALAEDLPKLDEADPTAKALLYVHDAAKVDKSSPQAARYEAGQTCANCSQIQGDASAEWRPCGIFPGKLVNDNGWCSVWAAKP
jgi:hypothetical protein